MIRVQIAIGCPHQYVDDESLVELLSHFEQPVKSDLFPTEAEKTRRKRAKKRAHSAEDELHRKKIIALGLTPVDPHIYEEPND